MSLIIRLSIVFLCSAALISVDNSTVLAQGSQGRSAKGIGDTIGGGNADSAANAAKKTTKKRFDELLAEKNLDKFRGYKQEAIGDGWKIVGKYMHFDGSGGGDIITKEQYTDFELQFDWKVSEGGNSGVMYRVSLGDNAPYMSGPEYQVLDDENHKDGKNEATSSGALYALYPPAGKRSPSAAGKWYKARIIVEGNKIRHYHGSTKVVEAEIDSADWKAKLGESKFKDWEKFAKNRTGHIAFQDHGNEVWYRNIRIKRLGDAEPVAATENKTQAQATRSRPDRTRNQGDSRMQKPSLSSAGGIQGATAGEDKEEEEEKNKGKGK